MKNPLRDADELFGEDIEEFKLNELVKVLKNFNSGSCRISGFEEDFEDFVNDKFLNLTVRDIFLEDIKVRGKEIQENWPNLSVKSYIKQLYSSAIVKIYNDDLIIQSDYQVLWNKFEELMDQYYK